MENFEQDIFAENTQEEKVVSIEETKKKRKPYHTWEVHGTEYKLKLTTSVIVKLEQKYHTNILNLFTSDNVPPLSVMLNVLQGAMQKYHHGIPLNKVENLYQYWADEEEGSQMDLLNNVLMPVFIVSGFFTQEIQEEMTEQNL